MSWVAVGVAVASAAVSQYNTRQTAKKRDRNAARGIAEQGKLQREANAKMNDQLDTLETSTPDDERTSRAGQIRDQLRLKQSLALGGIQNTGGGEAVTGRADAGKQTAVDYGDFINQAVSGMDAPMLQRQGENFMFADTANSLNTLGRHSAQQDNLTRLRAAGIRDNPWLSMLSQAGSAYAGSRMGGIPGGSPGGGAPLANLGGATPQQFYANPALPNMPVQGSGKIFNLFGP